MAPLTPSQLRTRRRFESVIRVMAPALDLVLAAGDRVSRIVEREDAEYYPPRVARPREGTAGGRLEPAGPAGSARTNTPPPR
jgi:hypothetical protein